MSYRVKSRTEQVVQARTDREVPDTLRDLYGRGLSQSEIAAALGVSRSTVIRWMRDFGIQTRDRRALAGTPE
jgi:transposase-like protein